MIPDSPCFLRRILSGKCGAIYLCKGCGVLGYESLTAACLWIGSSNRAAFAATFRSLGGRQVLVKDRSRYCLVRIACSLQPGLLEHARLGRGLTSYTLETQVEVSDRHMHPADACDSLTLTQIAATRLRSAASADPAHNAVGSKRLIIIDIPKAPS